MPRQLVSTIKKEQGYTKDAPKCNNCKFYKSKTEKDQYGYIHESMMKCGFGDFKTIKTAWCEEWQRAKN